MMLYDWHGETIGVPRGCNLQHAAGKRANVSKGNGGAVSVTLASPLHQIILSAFAAVVAWPSVVGKVGGLSGFVS